MSRLPLLPLALVIFAGCASTGTMAGPAAELPRTHLAVPTEAAITPADLMTRLYVIADDSMLGREAGTLGNVKVTNYVAREMARMGLRPGGEGGTYFQTVPVIIARIDTTRPLAVDGRTLALGTDVIPFPASSAGRALPMGETTRSLDGARAVYGGQLGGALIDPRDAAGKLVVFTVPAGANGRREWRFYTLGSLAGYAAAAGIAVAVLDVVPATERPAPARPRDAPAPGRRERRRARSRCSSPREAAARLLGVARLDGLQVGVQGRTVTGNLAFLETPGALPVAQRDRASCPAPTRRCAGSTSPSARTTITSASPTGRSTTTPCWRTTWSSAGRACRTPRVRRRRPKRRASRCCATASRARTAARAPTR